MSRLDKLGEILNGFEDRSSPQKTWYHRYDLLNENKIHGSFTYRDKENILTISYTISTLNGNCFNLISTNLTSKITDRIFFHIITNLNIENGNYFYSPTICTIIFRYLINVAMGLKNVVSEIKKT